MYLHVLGAVICSAFLVPGHYSAFITRHFHSNFIVITRRFYYSTFPPLGRYSKFPLAAFLFHWQSPLLDVSITQRYMVAAVEAGRKIITLGSSQRSFEQCKCLTVRMRSTVSFILLCFHYEYGARSRTHPHTFVESETFLGQEFPFTSLLAFALSSDHS